MSGGGDDFWAPPPLGPQPLAYAFPPGGVPVRLPQYHPPPPTPAPSAAWASTENRVFEAALVEFEERRADRWQRIAERIPGKTPLDVEEHYRRLVTDLRDIEAGVIEPPAYDERHRRHISFGGPRARAEERKKGTPWTHEEHARFLKGLEQYGRGDWRSISRNAVVTRTPTQVASHAQKFFLRQSMGPKKDRRRASIHDVVDA